MVWSQPLILTLQLMAASVGIAAVLGLAGAWAASSLDSRNRLSRWILRLFLAAMVAGAALPMILHAAAWEATAGKFGWWMLTQTGARTDRTGVYGFFSGLLASAWIHGLVGSSIVALATWWGTRRIPAVLIDQALMDSGPIAVWWRVRLPIASPWWITALMATAGLAATEMTVVDLYGYETIADRFYLYYAIDPTPMALMTTCFIPLAIAAILLVWMFIWRRRLVTTGREHFDREHVDAFPSIRWRCFAAVLALAIAAVIVVVPASGLIIKAGQIVVIQGSVVETSWSLSAFCQRLMEAPITFSSEYQWTAIIAAITGIVAVSMTWPIAAMGRTRRPIERVADALSVVLVCVPGPMVGLGMVSLFQANIPGFHSLYRYSLVPTVLALMFRAGPVAYWVLRSGYRGIDTAVVESASIDAGPLRRFWWIDRVLLRSHARVAFLAAAVMASGDVPATLPVVPAGVTTVPARLFGLLHSGARYQEASLALWYVTAIVAIAMICFFRDSTRRAKVG